jgi:hypothetical protein
VPELLADKPSAWKRQQPAWAPIDEREALQLYNVISDVRDPLERLAEAVESVEGEEAERACRVSLNSGLAAAHCDHRQRGRDHSALARRGTPVQRLRSLALSHGATLPVGVRSTEMDKRVRMSAITSPEAAQAWLGAYGGAWEDRDPDAAARLFTEDSSYAWGPFEEPLRGREAIRERWAEATRLQRDVDFGSEVLGVVSAGAVARWWCSFAVADARIELEGIFLIGITEDGECREFREWWNERTTRSAPR